MGSKEAQAVYVADKGTIKAKKGTPLGKASDVAALLADMATLDREHFVVLHMDVRNRVIERETVSIGCLTGVDVHPREVFKGAIMRSAASIIIAHNHPSGDPTPSDQDVTLTERLREGGKILGIAILDHVIIGTDGFISMAERGWR